MSSFAVTAIATVAAAALMIAESLLSKRNEHALRRAGAIEPADDRHRMMRVAYPAAFIAMAAEGAWRAWPPGATTLAAIACFVAAKALKYWAMASLGPLWSFRVLVLPGVPLVSAGPYRWLRHPNYVGVIGELAGFALLVGAPIAGVLGTASFALLLRQRIRVEEHSLGIAPRPV